MSPSVMRKKGVKPDNTVYIVFDRLKMTENVNA